MVCFTLRRSMLSSRAIVRWLWPAPCLARTVCSSETAGCATDGSCCSSAGAHRFSVASADGQVLSCCWFLMSSMRSSNEATSVSAGHALITAPIGPCARLAPTVATIPAARYSARARKRQWTPLALCRRPGGGPLNGPAPVRVGAADRCAASFDRDPSAETPELALGLGVKSTSHVIDH